MFVANRSISQFIVVRPCEISTVLIASEDAIFRENKKEHRKIIYKIKNEEGT